MSNIKFEAPDCAVQEAIDDELVRQPTFNSLLGQMEQCKIQLKRLIADIEIITDLAFEQFQDKIKHKFFVNHNNRAIQFWGEIRQLEIEITDLLGKGKIATWFMCQTQELRLQLRTTFFNPIYNLREKGKLEVVEGEEIFFTMWADLPLPTEYLDLTGSLHDFQEVDSSSPMRAEQRMRNYKP